MKTNTPVHPTSTSKQSSVNRNQTNPFNPTVELWQNILIIPPPTQQRKLFERKPLPESLIWKQDKEFEKWHNVYTTYIG